MNNRNAYILLMVLTALVAILAQDSDMSSSIAAFVILVAIPAKLFCIGHFFMDLKNSHFAYKVAGGIYTAILCVVLSISYI